jgi:hypothetical protein
MLILATVILGMLNVWFFSRGVIAFIVSVIFAGLLLSYYFPASVASLQERVERVDVGLTGPKRVEVPYDEIKNGRISLFAADGKPLLWYFRTPEGRYEFFDQRGHHPVYHKVLEPVAPEVIPDILETLKEDARRAVEERALRDTADRQLDARAQSQEDLAVPLTGEPVDGGLREEPQAPIQKPRLRGIQPVAYSHAREDWAKKGLGSSGFQHVWLEFRSGLLSGGTITWDARFAIENRDICLEINKLKMPQIGMLGEHYRDVSVGYMVHLENATFDDGAMARYLMLFRTFLGDAPPERIKKCFTTMPLPTESGENVRIAGRWRGRFANDHDSEDGVVLTARIDQFGDNIAGDAVIEFDEKKKKMKKRCDLEGRVLGDKVTFVATVKESGGVFVFVGSPSDDSRKLSGHVQVGLLRGVWSLDRIDGEDQSNNAEGRVAPEIVVGRY